MKKFWSLFLAFTLSLTLVACSNQPTNNISENDTPPAQTTETHPSEESSGGSAFPTVTPEDSTVTFGTESQSAADEEEAPTDDDSAPENSKPTPAPTPKTDPDPAPQPAYAPYIGNRNTKKFHYASCSSVDQMKSSNKVEIWDRSSAISGGYDPCKRCNP